MKLERLQTLLESQSRTKIFVRTDLFCLCGHARDPRPSGPNARGSNALSVRIGASVRLVLPTMELIQEELDSGTLLLTNDHGLTRRLQTHRRHLADLDVPEEYFERTRAL